MIERKTRRTEIMIETHSITTFRFKGNSHSAHCEHCHQTVPAFAPEEINEVLQLDLTEICRRIETKQIHLIHTGESTALICGASLKDQEIPKSQLLTDGNITNEKR